MEHRTWNKRRIYLDYAAATPLDPHVLKKMMPFMGAEFGNPSSLHEEGRIAKQALDKARSEVAQMLSVQPDEIIFTGSGTESAALALHGIIKTYPKGHIVTTSLEHAAVLENIRALQNKKYNVSILDAEQNGVVDPKKLAALIRKDTILISVMYINNEIGSCQPLREIASVIRKERNRRKEGKEKLPLYFHTDACQAAEYMSLSVPHLGVDLMTLNASKIYGPKGIGILYKRRGIAMKPFWEGGGQEQGLRSGTENIASIVGFAEALKITEKRKQKECARVFQLQQYFVKELARLLPNAALQGPPIGTGRVPNNVNVLIPGISAETLVLYLDERGVAASAGSACASQNQVHPHGVKMSEEGVRFTMGRHTTHADIDYTIQALCDSIGILE